MSKRPWDLTSRNSCQSGAEWMRKNAGGLLVLVVRAEDCVFAVDPQISPTAAIGMVELVLPEIRERLEAKARVKGKKAGVL